jgi:hypothetical protein
MILAVGLGAAALLAAPSARAKGVRVVTHAPTGVAAAGLLAPGRGPTFSRRETLDALDEIPRGTCPCSWTFYVTLPRAAPHEYEGLERVWIAGPGYPAGSLLVSDRTRISGLVSVYDLEPTAKALLENEDPPVTARADGNTPEKLEALEQRLDRAHDTRAKASLLLVGLIMLFSILTWALRSPLLGRAGLLVVPVGLAGALGLSALEVSAPTTVILVLAAIVALGAPAIAAVTGNRRALALALLAIFPLYLLTLGISTETSSFAAIGARPENGGRFYGFQNQIETMLLVPALLGAALLGLRALIPVALLALVTVGASFAGADGGGVLVFAIGFAFLWMRLREIPLTARNLALAGAGAIAVGLVLVGLDAALGGESHVTRAVGGGPLELAGDIAHRLRLSAGGVFSSLHAAIIIPVSLAALLWIALRRPRHATVDATLVAVAVSLLVNDSPRDVAAWGALSCGALRLWKDVRRVQ